jgi:hypothetical protein
MLAGITLAVKKSVTKKLNEWRGQMQRIRNDFASKGADMHIGVAFVETLLAVVDDQPANLADDNSHQSYLQQVLGEIAQYPKGENHVR